MANIAVGAILGILLLAGLIFFLYRRGFKLGRMAAWKSRNSREDKADLVGSYGFGDEKNARKQRAQELQSMPVATQGTVLAELPS